MAQTVFSRETIFKYDGVAELRQATLRRRWRSGFVDRWKQTGPLHPHTVHTPPAQWCCARFVDSGPADHVLLGQLCIMTPIEQ